jgi:hypothetical protein
MSIHSGEITLININDGKPNIQTKTFYTISDNGSVNPDELRDIMSQAVANSELKIES